MKRYRKEVWYLSAALSATAGFCDALGYLTLGGFFVSFMSGNSTRLGIGIARSLSDAAIAFSLILLFVGGVMAATIIQHKTKFRTAGFWLLPVLLLFASSLAMGGYKTAAIVFVALAMGAENTLFQREGEVSIGLTYMTGTLVKTGQHLAGAILGGPRYSWIPYAFLWGGLVCGATLGAISFHAFGLTSLWLATLSSFGCALWAQAARIASG